jgi:RES domain-containing protein
MLLWRLSALRHADAFDGSYGLLLDGRWNTTGHAVTYCATSPSLCVLEKLVHIEDPTLLPKHVMLTYEMPDPGDRTTIDLAMLPGDWRRRESWTRARGDAWHQSRSTLLLQVPSALVSLADCPDMNVLINHTHPAAAEVRIRARQPFVFDPRLL